MKKRIQQIRDWVDEHLRHLCGRIPPDKRLAVILTMLGVFGFASIYIFVNAIYNIGKNEGRQIEIEHIQSLHLQKQDSINLFNDYDNGREEN